jgi:hypothetical protein
VSQAFIDCIRCSADAPAIEENRGSKGGLGGVPVALRYGDLSQHAVNQHLCRCFVDMWLLS